MEDTLSAFGGGFDFGEDIEIIYPSEEFEGSKEQKPFSYTQNDVDERLASLLASNLDRGFQYLIQQYQVELLAKACCILRNQHTAEEVVQVAWAKAYRAMQRYSEERILGICLRSWLHTIVRNTAFEYYEREKKFTTLFSFEEGTILEKEGPRFEQPDIALICAESVSELHILVNQLPPHYAKVIQMRFFYESIGSGSGSYNWIAQELSCPVGTVKCYVNRGLHLLRKALQAKKVQLQELEILSL